MVLAVYPGTFDPMTLGHEDVLDRALSLFGRVIVAVAKSERKKPLFTLEERLDLARELVRGKPGVTVMGYEGLVCDFVHEQGARVIVRGVRAVSDFEYEFQLAGMNRELASEVETVFLMPALPYQFVSGRIPHPVTITEGKNGTVNNHPAYHAYMEDPYLHTGEDISGVMFVRYLKEGKRNTLFMNYGDTPETIEVSVESSDVPEVWDTFTGEIKTAEVVGQEGNIYRIRLELPCTYGVFVVSSL